MQNYIAQLENQVKKLQGDLQTSERETVGARKRVETEKFKTQLNKVLTDAENRETKKAIKLDDVATKMAKSVEFEDKMNKRGSEPEG